MNTPTRYESPPACIRRSKRLIRKTTPVPEAVAPVAQFETAVTSFENCYNAWAMARHQESIALGQQHEAEDALAEQLRGVGLAILTTSRGRRRSEVYRRYFPLGYGVTLQQSAQDALGTAAGLLTAMGDETSPDILARRDPLTAAQTALVSAVAARQAAVNALGEARATLEEGKSAWRSAYNTFYFALRTVFPDRRQWVESLFKVNGRRQPDDEQAANTGEATAGGTNGGSGEPTTATPEPEPVGSTSGPTEGGAKE